MYIYTYLYIYCIIYLVYSISIEPVEFVIHVRAVLQCTPRYMLVFHILLSRYTCVLCDGYGDASVFLAQLRVVCAFFPLS